jgi:Beta/Gamma crystallin
VTVFHDVNYQGNSRRFDRDVRDLRRSGWNDRISSYSIERRPGG